MSKAKRWLYNMQVNFGPEMARTKKEAEKFGDLMAKALAKGLKEMQAEGAIPAGCIWEMSIWPTKWDGEDEAHLAVDIDDERTRPSAVAALKGMGYSEEEIASNYLVSLADVRAAAGTEQNDGN